AHFTQHVNLAAAHFAPDVPAAAAVNHHAPGGHLSANPVHTGEVPFPIVDFVITVAADCEKLRQRELHVTLKDLESLDFGQRLSTDGIGRDPFDFEGNLRGRFEAKAKWHRQFQISDLGFQI